MNAYFEEDVRHEITVAQPACIWSLNYFYDYDKGLWPSSKGESTDAFQQLRINIKSTSGELKNTETIFLETKNALSKITNEAEKIILFLKFLFIN